MEAAIPRAFVFLGEQAAVQCQNLFSARRKPRPGPGQWQRAERRSAASGGRKGAGLAFWQGHATAAIALQLPMITILHRFEPAVRPRVWRAGGAAILHF